MSTPSANAPDLRGLITALEAGLATIEAPAIPALLGELERLKAALWIRATATPPSRDERPSPVDDLRHITPAEVATLLSVKEAYVHELCRTGRLPAAKHGKYWLVPVAALREWLATQRRDIDASARAAVLSTDVSADVGASPARRNAVDAIRRRVRLEPRSTGHESSIGVRGGRGQR